MLLQRADSKGTCSGPAATRSASRPCTSHDAPRSPPSVIVAPVTRTQLPSGSASTGIDGLSAVNSASRSLRVSPKWPGGHRVGEVRIDLERHEGRARRIRRDRRPACRSSCGSSGTRGSRPRSIRGSGRPRARVRRAPPTRPVRRHSCSRWNVLPPPTITSCAAAHRGGRVSLAVHRPDAQARTARAPRRRVTRRPS